MRITLTLYYIGSGADLEGAFAKMKENQVEALIVIAGALMYSIGTQIADLALAAHLFSCHGFKETAMAGGLISLGPDLVAMAGPAAAQIDRIIKGTRPADIPVEQPTRYEMYVNLKTARLLNLTIPPSLLARADEVIE
jgi:putative ABC transport system substrate-binding protein